MIVNLAYACPGRLTFTFLLLSVEPMLKLPLSPAGAAANEGVLATAEGALKPPKLEDAADAKGLLCG